MGSFNPRLPRAIFHVFPYLTKSWDSCSDLFAELPVFCVGNWKLRCSGNKESKMAATDEREQFEQLYYI